MKVILTHETPDLDALGSLALARRLHPGSAVVVTGGLFGAAAAAFNLGRDEIGWLEWDEYSRGYASRSDATETSVANQPDRVIVVDTHATRRLGSAASLTGLVTEIWDHHATGDLAAPGGSVRPAGSCVTLLAARLQAQDDRPTQLEATLALAGLMADTNGLLSFEVTPADFAAAAWLAPFADLDRVRELITDRLPEAGRVLLAAMLSKGVTETISQREVLTYRVLLSESLQAAPVAAQALAVSGLDAVILVVSERDRDGSDVIYRVRAGAFDAGAAALTLGGGGHMNAASARLSGLDPEAALKVALRALKDAVRPLILVRDVMTRVVDTVPDTATVEEAERILFRSGHGGAPLVDPAGQVTGVISRRELDRALQHRLRAAPARAVSRRAITLARPDDLLSGLETRMATAGDGRAPVLDEQGRLVGIVSLTDLLRRRQPQPAPSLAGKILSLLPPLALGRLKVIASLVPRGVKVYLVGGAIRDTLLGRDALDLDLSILPPEGANGGAAIALATAFAEHESGRVTLHERYGNASVTLGAGAVDFVTARHETYAHPGAAPDPLPGTLRHDLARRDFSINAIALHIEMDATGNLRGAVFDPHGGLADLEARLLRTLHPLSFLEDPSRIVRAARLAARLNLTLDRETQTAIPSALAAQRPSRTRPARVTEELRLAFHEPAPGRVFALLKEWAALESLYGDVDTLKALAALDEERRSGQDIPADAYRIVWAAGRAAGQLKLDRLPPRCAAAAARAAAANEPEAYLSLSKAELAALSVLDVSRAEAARGARRNPPRQLLGRDVLALGAPAGPAVGKVLAVVREARRQGHVTGFDSELELARHVMRHELQVGKDPT